ncbi:MAG: hypothetical protein F4066_06640 [Chloroflexi bacterium]|nr:hypothetical protein [Chloroflexota bacterium]MYF81301.1 hypothetical protein [Chloroflexota bacterium]MYI04522.1 hypothetical protein [Chloroflexota bacterium]
MLRRFNETGRKTIAREHASVRIRPSEGDQPTSFKVDFELEDYNFSPDAVVRIEAWRSNIGERWEAGTVRDVVERGYLVDQMREAPITSQFRVVVVEGDGTGKLLGASGPIKPRLPVESLIALEPQDLGAEVWRVDFGDGDRPTLLVNNQLEMMSEIVRNDAQFRALVMPQVLRSVLTQIVFVDGADLDDEEDGWHKGWFILAQSVHGGQVPKVTERDDQAQAEIAQDWIEQVVSAFSEQKVHAADLYREVQQAAT